MDRFTRGVVVAVLLLVLVAVGIAIARPRSEPLPDPSTPRGVVAAYLRALRENQPDQAWEYLASSVQERVPRERFVQLASVRGDDRRLVSIGEATVIGDQARVPVVSYYDGGLFGGTSSSEQVALLVQEDGQWRISSPTEPFLPDVPPR